MKKLSTSEYDNYIAGNNAAILFDAAWDIEPGKEIREKLNSAELKFENAIVLGEVDVDTEQELANEINILNVPAVAYYKNGELFKVEIGANQEVEKNIKGLLT